MKSLPIGIAARLLGALALGIAMSAGAAAQTWYASDGGLAIEQGRGGVKMLAGGLGFISVGSTTSGPTGTSDVYVVETNPAGAIIFSHNYDFGGTNEVGYDITELAGGGFAITGSTTAGGGATDAFIMTTNAMGIATAMATFGGPNNDVGLDILQQAGAPNNLVVAGYSTTAAGTTDGLLIRVGLPLCPIAPVFVNTYAPPGGGNNDYFNGLWEATVGGPGVAVGDFILCGGTNSVAGTTDAWLMRVTAAGAIRWSNTTGAPGASAEVFNSVTQLAVPVTPGAIVAVGSTTGIPPQSFYVAKFFGATGVQIGPDFAGGPPGSTTEMFSVRENQIVNPGHLILAGHTIPGGLGGDDAYVMEMLPGLACPGAKVWSKEYGGAGADRFYSGEEANLGCTAGYIFCGLTASPALLPAGDPQNMYLVRTDAAGVTGCEFVPVDNCNNPGYATVGFPVVATLQAWGVCHNHITGPLPGNLVLCLTACPENHEHRQGSDGIAGVEAQGDGAASANAYPNPVVAGNSFTVQYTMDKSSGAESRVLVSDISGKVVFDKKVDGTAATGTLVISTSGWETGTYLVKLGSGSASQTKRIVVIDK